MVRAPHARVLARWFPLSVVALVSVVSGVVSCSEADHSADTMPADEHAGHGESTTGTATGALGPSCDEDNPIHEAAPGAIDRTLPDAIVQFERQLKWGCAHREWHESRQWDYIANDPKQADRYTYAKMMGWKAADRQEGVLGSGLDFLAMHRAMVVTLRDRFPEQAHLFEGWAAVPIASTAADPLPATGPDGGAPTPFYVGMKQAITRVETDPASFATDDELGLFIETRHRPTPGKPFDQTQDLTTGLHAFIHSRFDDLRSPIHMELFSRNIENETFFRFHGWIDRIWTQWRTAHGLDDAKDAAYGEAMHHACMHMGLAAWDGARGTCTK
ncbi:MAG: hypothetical protein JWP87_5643 [Labilithrix sp.]|nr:hypothetical protein [Labilithrix sp.]